jgi:hypothetical protein
MTGGYVYEFLNDPDHYWVYPTITYNHPQFGILYCGLCHIQKQKQCRQGREHFAISRCEQGVEPSSEQLSLGTGVRCQGMGFSNGTETPASHETWVWKLVFVGEKSPEGSRKVGKRRVCQDPTLAQNGLVFLKWKNPSKSFQLVFPFSGNL